MRHFVLAITGHLPYPLKKTYQITATSWHTATSRAIRLYRADNKNKAKRLAQLDITVKPLKGLPSIYDNIQEPPKN